MVNKFFPLKYLDIIVAKSDKYALEPSLVCAVIRTESRFEYDAVSRKSAKGLMQIMEQTAYWAANEIGMENFSYDRIFDPEINIEIGCWYLNNLINQFGSKELALAAYNAGSGNLSKWINDPEYFIDNNNLNDIPFEETRNYLKKVAFFQNIYDIRLRFQI